MKKIIHPGDLVAPKSFFNLYKMEDDAVVLYSYGSNFQHRLMLVNSKHKIVMYLKTIKIAAVWWKVRAAEESFPGKFFQQKVIDGVLCSKITDKAREPLIGKEAAMLLCERSVYIIAPSATHPIEQLHKNFAKVHYYE